MELFASSAFGAAVVFGFRHGFDWDHIAALTDLTGSQQSRRRSMVLATLYAIGHAAMVLLLGLVAIVFAARLPESVDVVLGRFVGVTLIALAVYIAWSAVTRPGQLPVRSRWMLLLTGLQRLVVRRRARNAGPVVIEHAHAHDHRGARHGHPHGTASHDRSRRELASEVVVAHRHTHQHRAVMPDDPFITYTSWSSVGIGMLHGVGAETPTQVLIFAAAASAGGTPTSIGLLACFIVGILAANTVVAAASTYGFNGLARRPAVVLVLSVVTAAVSLVVGMLFVLGRSASLPGILAG